MAISRAKLLKRMADRAVVEARKKRILKKVTEKPLSKKPPSGAVAKKVENKARKESSAAAKKAQKGARKDLKDELNYDKNIALKTKAAGAIGTAGVGGALYGRSKIKKAEKKGQKVKATEPKFEFKQLPANKKKAGGIVDRQYLKGR